MAPTAIVVPFHDVPAAVTNYRRTLTTDGADGIPPHVTLMYPFVDDADLCAGEVEQVRGVLGAFPSFDVTFARLGRFDAEPPVLYLEPKPAEPFRVMIAALEREFPAFPPFGGVHETVIPHLTIAYSDDATALEAVETAVERHLPIHAHVDDVALMEHRTDGWRLRERIALGA